MVADLNDRSKSKMESDNMVSLVSYNLLMTTTFDFPIDEKNGKLDQEYEYKWDCDCSSDSSFNPFMTSTEVKIELKPDHGIVPYHIGIMKLQKLAETLKENENKSALTAHINKTFSNVAVVASEDQVCHILHRLRSVNFEISLWCLQIFQKNNNFF